MRLRTLIGASFALTIAVVILIGANAPSGRAQTEIDPAPADPAAFSPTITNKYFPLSLIGPKVFEGTDTDPDTGEVVETRLESRVLPETIVVAGVTVTVLEEKAYDDGELVEVALDYFAQHTNGDVYYFGEAVDNYEDGAFKDHAGQWLAGENGASPGIYVAANPVVGTTYEQELAPGIAEDKSEVLVVGESVRAPAGTYSDCVKTRDYTPLEPGVEETKWHCAGAGLVREEGDGSVNELVSVGAAPAVGAATPAASAGTPVVAPAAGTGSDGGGATPIWMMVAVIAALLGVGGVVGARVVRSR